ncbi:MAG: DNA polymerase III subunit gamma/tau [Candidatus Aquicultor sp.]|nr:DNA polymerase III subunit gamma/tau [Candidatus Aquicultor sp.]
MSYVSLYRKWRPQTFDEIAGQSHITQTLQNAIDKGRISHAYLFCGPRGTGKTTTARALAKAINCIEGPTSSPCNKCESCRSINDGSSIDVLELDAASNRRVEEIRDLLEKIPYSASGGNKKVYIIDEVHMLTTESFNTLLKTLEEPPEHVIFVLATTEPHKVIPTILSRCQRFDFRRISPPDIEARLAHVAEAEGISIETAALSLISHHAQGALRDALGALEQLGSYTNEKITSADVIALLGLTDSELLFDFTDLLSKGDLAGGLLFIDELVAKGVDLRQFIQDLLGHLRNVFLRQSVRDMQPAGVPDDFKERLSAQAAQIEPQTLTSYIQVLNDVYGQSRWSTDLRLLFEIALFKLAKSETDASFEGILRRLERLESAALNGALSPAPAAPASTPKKTARASTPKNKDEAAPTAPTVPLEPVATVEPASAQATKAGATATLPASGGDFDIETVRQAWPQVLKLVKEKKPSRYNFFAGGKPVRVDSGMLTLALKKSDKDFVETPENIQLLRNTLKLVTGFDIPIQCELANGAPKTVAVPEGDAAADDMLAPDDYIKLVQDTFGAKIVEDISVKETESQGEES